MNGCVYKNADGRCSVFSNEKVTSFCVNGPCPYEKPSNYDRIVSKTPEELAEWLDNLINHCYEGPCINCFMREACQTSMLSWLKSPVEVDK